MEIMRCSTLPHALRGTHQADEGVYDSAAQRAGKEMMRLKSDRCCVVLQRRMKGAFCSDHARNLVGEGARYSCEHSARRLSRLEARVGRIIDK